SQEMMIRAVYRQRAWENHASFAARKSSKEHRAQGTAVNGEEIRITEVSNITVLRATGGDALPGDVSCKVVLSSACTNWRNFLMEEHRFIRRKLDDSVYIQHVIAVNLGPPIICHLKKDNGIQRVCKPTGTIFLAPSHEPFFRYCHVSDDSLSARVLYVALD